MFQIIRHLRPKKLDLVAKLKAKFDVVRFITFKLFILLASGIYTIKAYAQITRADDDKFQQTFRRLKRNDSLQFELTEAPPLPETPSWLKALGEFIGAIFEFLGPILYVLFYVGLGAIAMGIIYLLATTLMAARFARRDKTEETTDTPLYQPEQAQARILLAEIDALAAKGEYGQAVHILLFRSIQDIDANRPNIIRRSLTSREIGQLSILTPQARSVFSNIASIVERSFFGGQNIGRSDFDTARAAYAELTDQSGQWATNGTQVQAA